MQNKPDYIQVIWISENGKNRLEIIKNPDIDQNYISFMSQTNLPDFSISDNEVNFSSFRYTTGNWFSNLNNYIRSMLDNMSIKSCEEFISFLECNSEEKFTKYIKH